MSATTSPGTECYILTDGNVDDLLAIAALARRPDIKIVWLSTVESDNALKKRRFETLRALCEVIGIQPTIQVNDGRTFQSGYPIELYKPDTSVPFPTDKQAINSFEIRPDDGSDVWTTMDNEVMKRRLASAPDGSWLVVLRPFMDLMELEDPVILRKFRAFMSGGDNVHHTALVKGAQATEEFLNQAFFRLTYFEANRSFSSPEQLLWMSNNFSQTMAELDDVSSKSKTSPYRTLGQLIRTASQMWTLHLASVAQPTNIAPSGEEAEPFDMTDVGLATLIVTTDDQPAIRAVERLTVHPKTYCVTPVFSSSATPTTVEKMTRARWQGGDMQTGIYVPVPTPLAVYDEAMMRIFSRIFGYGIYYSK